MGIKHKKLQEYSNQIEKGLDYNELIELRKKVYNVKTEMYSDEWYEKRMLLDCIKEFLDESKPTKEQEEQKIFKEFEELGYKVEKHNDSIDFRNTEKEEVIFINLLKKMYAKTDTTNLCIPLMFTLKEHQPLHKLFELWGWFDE